MNVIGKFHEGFINNRRVQVLSSYLSELIPKDSRVLDVGCGDGLLDALVMKLRPDLSITGIDVLPRKQNHISIKPFDGLTIPDEDRSFDVILFIDVLHHTDHPEQLLAEAKRVSKGVIVLKDHTKKGIFAGPTLRFMDWVGNAHHGVALPYNYWTENQWQEAFSKLNLKISCWNSQITLYPFPVNLFFDRSLHFITMLKHG